MRPLLTGLGIYALLRTSLLYFTAIYGTSDHTVHSRLKSRLLLLDNITSVVAQVHKGSVALLRRVHTHRAGVDDVYTEEIC